MLSSTAEFAEPAGVAPPPRRMLPRSRCSSATAADPFLAEQMRLVVMGFVQMFDRGFKFFHGSRLPCGTGFEKFQNAGILAGIGPQT